MSLRKALFGNLHSRLAWIIFATAIPIFAGLFFYVYQQRSAIVKTSRDNGQNLVALTALYEQSFFRAAIGTLQTVATAPVIKNGDWRGCDRYFAHIVERQPQYSNLGVIGTDGHVLCSGRPAITPEQRYLGDRSYFRRSLAGSGPVVGDYQIGRMTHQPTMVLALKMHGPDGSARGIVYVALALSSLSGPEMGRGLGRSRFVVVDRSGTVLQASPGSSYAPGSRLNLQQIRTSVGNRRNGAAEMQHADGSDWYVNYAAVGTTDDPFAISVIYETPLDDLLFDANHAFVIGIAVTLLLMALALAGGWALTQIAVGRNIRHLTDAVDRLGRHDFSIAVASVVSGKEFLEIGRQFDRMAQELAAHERKLLATAARHAGQNDILRLIAQSHPLQQTLEALACFIEGQISAVVGSILLLDARGFHVVQCIGPHLPPDYRNALTGLSTAPDAGSCGAAMHEGRVVIANDIASDPNWTGYKDLVLVHGLRSCWSCPIMGSSGQVFGSLALYDRHPRSPSDEERTLLQMTAELAAVAIERDRIKESLYQSEQEYRLLFERNPNPMLVYSVASRRILAVNDCAVGHYGYERKELLEMTMAALECEDGPVPGAEAGDPSGPFQTRHRRKDGSAISVEVALFPLNFAGQPARLALIHDVTEREAMERDIIEHEEKLSLLMHSTSEAIYGLDLEGRCTFANNACAKLLGYESADQLVGLNLHEAVHYKHKDGSGYPQHECRLHDALQTGHGAHVDDEVLWRRDGTAFPVEYWSYPTVRDGRITGCVVTFIDISERCRQREELEHQATHDMLTGLLNRSVLLPRIELAIADAERSGSGFSVLIIDLDGFKEVNDALGHQSGDLLLQEVGRRFQQALADSDTLVRLGGDEFAVILCSAGGPAEAERVVQDLLRQAKEPFELNQLQVRISASMGIAEYPRDGIDPTTLMRHADIAMYKSKREGVGYSAFDRAEGERIAHKVVLMADLRSAVSNGEFLLYYQPKVSLPDMRPVGFEALARWQHRQRGMVGPDQFMPMIEVSDLIHPFSVWVIENALGECARWYAEGIEMPVAVNVSTRNLLDLNLPDRIEASLRRHRLPSRLLELEITESSIMADPVRSLEVLLRLHRIGVSIAIDDFGTGYSSLAYLQRLPVQSLKIDRSFVLQMNQQRDALAIVSSIIELAHTTGVSVVAEGIETQDAFQKLAELGCDYAQGYYVARPMPAFKARSWLARHGAPVRQRVDST